jgi:hypothetical protein
MEDEAKVRFGVDNDSVHASLRGVEHAFEQTGERVKDVFKEVGHHITSIFATGAVIAGIERTLSVAQRLTRQSESLGASTDFIQNITNVGRAAGLSSEQMEKMLNKFATALPEGANLEDEFFKVADSIKSIEDPATRVQVAIELFGKKIGPQFVSTLARGRQGIEDFAKQFAIMSRGEISNLEEAKLAIEKTENFATIFIGRAINMATFISKLIDDVNNFERSGGRERPHTAMDFVKHTNDVNAARENFGDGSGSFANSALVAYKSHLDDIRLKSKDASTEEKLGILTRRKEFMEHQVGIVKTEEARYKLLEHIADIEEDILEVKKKQADEEKKAEEKAAQRARHIHKQEIRTFEADRELSDVKKKPYEFSLEELAATGVWGGGGSGWGARPFGFQQPLGARIAKQILNLQSRAKEAFEWGNVGTGEVLRRRADQMFDSLASSNPYLVNPQERAARAAEKQHAILDEWNKNGVPVVSEEE